MSEKKAKKKVTKKVTKETSSEPTKIEKKTAQAKSAFQYQGKKFEKGQTVDLGIEAMKQLEKMGLI